MKENILEKSIVTELKNLVDSAKDRNLNTDVYIDLMKQIILNTYNSN